MFKRKTSKLNRPRPKVLESRVHSPRILWFGLVRACGKTARLIILPAVLLGLLAAGMLGLQRAFLKNRDFQLRQIDLNDNPVLDERMLVECGGIDPEGSLFAVDPAALARRLTAMPAVAKATVTRELPGTLRVRIEPRVPVAWLAIPAHGAAARDPGNGWLVDASGLAFPARGFRLPEPDPLPTIVVNDPTAPPLTPGELRRDPELTRALDLLRLAAGMTDTGEFGIAAIEHENAWSMLVQTTAGVRARFGLTDHARQLDDLLCANRHALDRGYKLATIDLIPTRNIPVTLAEPPPPPRAIPVEEPDLEPPPRAVPVAEPQATPHEDARDRDLQELLERG